MELQQLLIDTIPWFKTHGLKILLIIIGAFIIQHFSKTVIAKIIRKVITQDHAASKEAEEKRENTLIRILSGTTTVLVWIIAIMIVLQELGLDIGPLIAAAGVAGLAIGFGAQYLIRDIITGLFIIIESQYRIGDVVCFDNTCGTVEDISMRMTTLRDMDGTAHHIPHGEIKRVSNMSKTFARVNLNIGISYGADINKAIATINEVGQTLAKDPLWKEKILTPPAFLRVQDLGDSAVTVKITGDTKPLEQWAVMGELRKRLKEAFDANGIEIPYPQQVVHIKKEYLSE